MAGKSGSKNEDSLLTSISSDVEFNPNQRLSSVLLNEFNYLSWARAVTLALGGRSKLGYINGVIQMPEAKSPTYDSWLCNDQLVMSWLLNSMESRIREIFSFSESSMHLWKYVKEMYGNQNNAARVFQLKRDIADLQQEGKSFVQHLGSLTSMWNELDVYRPHTTEASVLLKRADEDKIFQLLASLNSDYEDLRSHILMNSELPSFNTVCATIQREEVRKKVMNMENKSSLSETRAYVSNHRQVEERTYKGKRTDLKCTYCEGVGHVKDRCWILHPEQKPKFSKEGKILQKGWSTPSHRAKLADASYTRSMMNFTSNPTALINEFATYLNMRQMHGGKEEPAITGSENHTALLGKFAGFLAETDCVSHEEASGSHHQGDDW
ncbi:putative transcription factor interactor and regulator CCHC(Zn) family [Rosa chinensis]|uniref:Putative transcription factor interactor and regulator CCHC(Zn) family n=1 Tax=Rosa chinensis TaxID=74649 RepID=A0A2P6R6I4_ROSCH|nr:putative transcription factor interactor and regulator CCHC(Zn) family [Rosa chinensis]